MSGDSMGPASAAAPRSGQQRKPARGTAAASEVRPGTITASAAEPLQRLAVTPRADWRAHVERDLGFAFHTIGGAPYWDETVCYGFTAAEIDEIEAATDALEQMALALVDHVVQTGEEALERLRIPRIAWET